MGKAKLLATAKLDGHLPSPEAAPVHCDVVSLWAVRVVTSLWPDLRGVQHELGKSTSLTSPKTSGPTYWTPYPCLAHLPSCPLSSGTRRVGSCPPTSPCSALILWAVSEATVSPMGPEVVSLYNGINEEILHLNMLVNKPGRNGAGKPIGNSLSCS